MRKKWFDSVGSFETAYNVAVDTLGQDADLWLKRSRKDVGKEDQHWDSSLTPRRWPQPVTDPNQNPNFYTNAGQAYDFTLTSEGIWRHDEPSGFSFDFTTSADCNGMGIATEGTAYLPPLTLSSDPERNFKYLPFPLAPSSCQLQDIDGPQTTVSRPFT